LGVLGARAARAVDLEIYHIAGGRANGREIIDSVNDLADAAP